MRVRHIASIVDWLMSDAERAILFGGVPLFVSVNGEENVPATLDGGRVIVTIGRTSYRSPYAADRLRRVDVDGDVWYEIDDSDLALD